VADPYSEKLLDPYNDPSIPAGIYSGLSPYPTGLTTEIAGTFQTASSPYNWTTPGFSRPDKKQLIIYELLLRDFLSDHSWGRLADTLNYLSGLGINAIELMPFNEFEGNSSWGYNPSFYFAPDKYYGKANDLKRFVDLCHAKGIAVIMDIALNHSFGQSPMVRMYWDAVNNRPASNNPWFNPTARHPFSVGYDFNHESQATGYFVSRILEHWMQRYHIDGFRFDLSKGFTQKQTCDSNGNNCDATAWAAYDSSRIAILSRYYDSIQSYGPGAYIILEHFADNSEEKVLSNKGFLLWGNMNYNYAQASMGYQASSDLSYGLYNVRGWQYPHLITYMESHDEERINYKNINSGNVLGNYSVRDSATADRRLEMSYVMLLSQPGPKMIWQFGELGYDYPINYCENGTISSSCRTEPKPVRWDYKTISGRREIFESVSLMNRLRQHPYFSALFGSAPASADLAGQVKWIKLSAANGAGVLSMANFDLSTKTISVSFPSAGTWYDYFNPPDSIVASGGNRDFQLKPGEFHVYINHFLPLPGTVLNITGRNAGFQNDLNWEVLEEQTVSSYELQRSFDSINFSFVSGINATGSGSYVYADDVSMLSTNVYFYRLKVLFADGSFRFSRVIRLQSNPLPGTALSFRASPNPFLGQLLLYIGLPEAGESELRVLDVAGRLIRKQKLQLVEGLNTVPLSGHSFPSTGVYFLQLVGTGYSKIISVVKAR
jgi:glycosidase